MPIVSTSIKVHILCIKTYIFIYLNTENEEEWKFNSDKNQILLWECSTYSTQARQLVQNLSITKSLMKWFIIFSQFVRKCLFFFIFNQFWKLTITCVMVYDKCRVIYLCGFVSNHRVYFIIILGRQWWWNIK